MEGEPARLLRHQLRSPMRQPIQRRDTHGFARANSYSEVKRRQTLNIQSFSDQFWHRHRENVASTDRGGGRDNGRTAVRNKLAGQPLDLPTVHRPKRERVAEVWD